MNLKSTVGPADAAPISPALPFEALGPYLLSAELGRGAGGVVYRAIHRETRQVVALKTLPRLQQVTLLALRREVNTLSALKHPSVVSFLESGVQGELPWVAMELVEGEPLSQPRFGYLERRRHLSAELALAEVLTLVHQICGALSYVHGEGLVHRDLKPANVVLRADQQPVLLDFGLTTRLTTRQGRDALETASALVGTAAYMAPELLRGEPFDARADLYALGCLLYELLTGQPPFVGNLRELLQQHQQQQPLPPSHRVPELPAALDVWVLRLLAKTPRERIGYASDLARGLERLLSPPPIPLPEPRTYLYSAPLVGREKLLFSLVQQAQDVEEGQGRLTLLLGESGVGKTRLLVELTRRLRGTRFQMLTGACSLAPGDEGQPVSLRPPFEPLLPSLQAVVDLCLQGGPSTTQQLLGTALPVLQPYLPALAQLPGAALQPQMLPTLPPLEAQQRSFQAMLDVLSRLAALKPLLLLLDDLQWADGLTWEWLAYLAKNRSLERLPLWILATCRTDERGSALTRLQDLNGVQTVALSRLDQVALERLVGEMLALPSPPPVLTRLLRETSGGNPFFVAQYLHLAVQERLLFRDREGRWCIREAPGRAPAHLQALDEESRLLRLTLPHSLRALCQQRLELLSVPAQETVHAAAVLGRFLEPELLQALTGLSEPLLLRALDELLRREVLEEVRGGLFRFVHPQLSEVAYEHLPPERRGCLHGRAAELLRERLDLSPRGQGWAELGRHLEQAQAHEEAVRAYEQALEGALARHAYGEAEQLLRATLALLPKHDVRCAHLQLRLATEVLRPRGRNQEALSWLELALPGLEPLRAVLCLQALSEMSMALKRPEQALRWILEALSLHESLHREPLDRGASLERARIQQRLGGILGLQATGLTEARLAYEQALELLEQFPNPPLMADVHKELGRLAWLYARDAERTRHHLTQAVTFSQGDPGLECITLTMLASFYLALGPLARATETLRQAQARLPQVTGLQRMHQVLLIRAAFAAHFEAPEGAAPVLEELRWLLRRSDDQHSQVMLLHVEGVLCMTLGRLEEAERALKRCLEQADERLERQSFYATAALGRLYLDQGRAEEAERMLRLGLYREQQVWKLEHGTTNAYMLSRLEREVHGDLEAAERLLKPPPWSEAEPDILAGLDYFEQKARLAQALGQAVEPFVTRLADLLEGQGLDPRCQAWCRYQAVKKLLPTF